MYLLSSPIATLEQCSQYIYIGVASLYENEEAMFPVAAADIFGSNNLCKRRNVYSQVPK